MVWNVCHDHRNRLPTHPTFHETNKHLVRLFNSRHPVAIARNVLFGKRSLHRKNYLFVFMDVQFFLYLVIWNQTDFIYMQLWLQVFIFIVFIFINNCGDLMFFEIWLLSVVVYMLLGKWIFNTVAFLFSCIPFTSSHIMGDPDARCNLEDHSFV